ADSVCNGGGRRRRHPRRRPPTSTSLAAAARPRVGFQARPGSTPAGGPLCRGKHALHLARDTRARPEEVRRVSKVVAHVVGARPNYMKMAPVYAALAHRGLVDQYLIHTGQHYDSQLNDV